jgi:membrane associated rhomboid family serine protease
MAWEDRPYRRDEADFGMRFGFPTPTPLAMGLIGACLIIFVIQAIAGDLRSPASPISYWGGLSFYHGRAFTQPWRWITYQYLHGGVLHVFFNVLGIYFFVPPLEKLWGARNTFIFYTLGGIVAGATFGVLHLFLPYGAGNLIGASGAIFAILGALALLMPEMQILLFFIIPISIRAIADILGLLFFLWVISEKDPSSAAHLGGLVFGFVAPYYGRGQFAAMTRKLQRSREKRETLSEQREQADIDAILAKVSAHGMQSLTWFEKRALRKATENQRARDLARAQRGR